MNIPVEKFRTTDLNIIFMDDSEFHWFQFPAMTFKNPENYFYIRRGTNSVNWLVSRNRKENFMIEISTRGKGVDFKRFLRQSFPLSPSANSALKPFEQSPKSEPSLKLEHKIRKIKAVETNISYHLLFADYLKDTSAITIQDPYIRQPHQFENFMEFCQRNGRMHFTVNR